jgi:hypothetical protein
MISRIKILAGKLGFEFSSDCGKKTEEVINLLKILPESGNPFPTKMQVSTQVPLLITIWRLLEVNFSQIKS